MTSVPLAICAIVALTAVGIVALPWTDAQLDASASAWRALGRAVGRWAFGPPRFDGLPPRVGVAPPAAPPVWSPPAEVGLRRAS